MGWWTQDKDGNSFGFDESEMLWGDEPADVMDSALAAIADAFERSHNRRPMKAEVRAGLEFSIGATTSEEI